MSDEICAKISANFLGFSVGVCMDWLKNIIKNLPLESISEWVSKLVIWWSNITSSIPADDLPFYAYVGSAVAVLLLLLCITRLMPRMFGSVFWLMCVAVFLTPDTLSTDGQVAPAVAGVAHGILMKDYTGAMSSLLPILTVFVVLLCVGAIWQILRGVVESNVAKAREQAEIQAQKQAINQNSDHLA